MIYKIEKESKKILNYFNTLNLRNNQNYLLSEITKDNYLVFLFEDNLIT